MTPLLKPVADYYAEKLAQHGVQARGVDWNNPEGQSRRFEVLLRVVEGARRAFTIDDYGCGYGALLDHLRRREMEADYFGLDVSEPMVDAARRRHPADGARFAPGVRSPRRADYAVASGIFNVRLAAADESWARHVCATLETMHECSRHGFAFNCLTRYADRDHMKAYLYYGDPSFYFDFCQRRFSRHVALFHDYGLYEFAILVRKSAAP